MNPFLSSPPRDVPLERAPLEVVVAALRFPDVLSLAGEGSETMVRLQSELADEFPEVRTERVQLAYGDDEVDRMAPIWRFFDESSTVRLSVAKHGFTLETKNYLSREQFLESFSRLFSVFQGALDVPVKSVDQISIRYVNRVQSDALDRIPELVNSKLLGMTEFIADDGDQGGNSVGTVQFALPGGEEPRMVVFRYGRVRGGQSVDPSTVPIIESPSWMLDIDCGRAVRMKIGSQNADVVEELNRLAERAYAVFRWAVTEEFLRYYGGAS